MLLEIYGIAYCDISALRLSAGQGSRYRQGNWMVITLSKRRIWSTSSSTSGSGRGGAARTINMNTFREVSELTDIIFAIIIVVLAIFRNRTYPSPRRFACLH
jgi:hypothetical protein